MNRETREKDKADHFRDATKMVGKPEPYYGEDENPDKKGNIRNEANVSQLVCLANLETLNAHFIHLELPQAERLKVLNHQTAIHQMKLLLADRSVQQLERKNHE
jgi:hypothetical protein